MAAHIESLDVDGMRPIDALNILAQLKSGAQS
jgi:hypothetical protein